MVWKVVHQGKWFIINQVCDRGWSDQSNLCQKPSVLLINICYWDHLSYYYGWSLSRGLAVIITTSHNLTNFQWYIPITTYFYGTNNGNVSYFYKPKSLFPQLHYPSYIVMDADVYHDQIDTAKHIDTWIYRYRYIISALAGETTGMSALTHSMCSGIHSQRTISSDIFYWKSITVRNQVHRILNLYSTRCDLQQVKGLNS